MRYEKKVHKRLQELYPLDYSPSLWFRYGWKGQIKFCQIDGLLLFPKRNLAVLVEVKYSHTADAYWQLENLYVPVVKMFLEKSPYHLSTVEIVKWYDPAVLFPCASHMVDSLDLCKPGNFSVHILNR